MGEKFRRDRNYLRNRKYHLSPKSPQRAGQSTRAAPSLLPSRRKFPFALSLYFVWGPVDSQVEGGEPKVEGEVPCEGSFPITVEPSAGLFLDSVGSEVVLDAGGYGELGRFLVAPAPQYRSRVWDSCCGAISGLGEIHISWRPYARCSICGGFPRRNCGLPRRIHYLFGGGRHSSN